MLSSSSSLAIGMVELLGLAAPFGANTVGRDLLAHVGIGIMIDDQEDF